MVQAQNLIADIDAEIAANKIMVYSKSWCGFCSSTKQLLQSKGFTFEVKELDLIENGDAIQNALKTKTGQRTVPNVFVNGEHIGGNSELQAAN